MPRLVIVLVVIFSDYIGRAYEGFLWPFLGFLFMPVTTLAYAWAVYRLDENEPEPFPLLAFAFLWGAVPAVLLTYFSPTWGLAESRFVRAVVVAPDGKTVVRDQVQGPVSDVERLGAEVGGRLLGSGAEEILEEVYGAS